MAHAVALVRVENEDLVRFGDRLVLPEMSDVETAIREDHVRRARSFFLTVVPAATRTLNIPDRDESRLQQLAGGHLRHRPHYRAHSASPRPQRRINDYSASRTVRPPES